MRLFPIYHPKRRWRHPLYILGALVIVFLFTFVLLYSHFFGPANPNGTQQQFIVQPGESVEQVIQELRSEHFIKSSTAFRIAYLRYSKGAAIHEGGYEISASMDAWTIANAFSQPPYLVWVTFPTGLRKEQIADTLAKDLGWTDAQKAEFINIDTDPDPSQVEGVYYGDTYLIPTDQPPSIIAARIRGRFQEVFAPYAAEAKAKGIPWTDVLTMASLIEREAAKSDKTLISGILWNRVHKHMALQVDATLQYFRGTEGNWWPVPNAADKTYDSPFNTYKYVGLPPHPIANPSLESIDAALNPEKTNCLYYLHDPNGKIHCSATYAGQLANVNKYLK